MFTFAILNVAGWIATFYLTREYIREHIKAATKAWKEKGRYYHDLYPERNPTNYPWSMMLIGMVVGVICTTVLALIGSWLWPVSWTAIILGGLYLFVPKFQALADNTWIKVKALKASVEAKLRG